MIKPKFELGQRVCAVSIKYDKKTVPVPCVVCKSTGKIEISGVKGIKYTCPECKGTTKTVEEGFRYYVSFVDATIGKREIEEYFSEYYLDKVSKVSYMLDKTGVDSGQLWREDRLFATLEEAEEFCSTYVPTDRYDNRCISRNKEE